MCMFPLFCPAYGEIRSALFDLAHIMYIFSNFALFEVPYILHFKLLS